MCSTVTRERMLYLPGRPHSQNLVLTGSRLPPHVHDRMRDDINPSRGSYAADRHLTTSSLSPPPPPARSLRRLTMPDALCYLANDTNEGQTTLSAFHFKARNNMLRIRNRQYVTCIKCTIDLTPRFVCVVMVTPEKQAANRLK